MGIKDIKLGPKSPYAATTTTTADKDAWVDAVMDAAGKVGCSCGQYILRDRDELYELRGVIHRAGNPCHAKDGSKQVGVLPGERYAPKSSTASPPKQTIEERMANVERVMADLLIRLRRHSPATWDDV